MNRSQNQIDATAQTTGAPAPRKQSMARGIAAATIGNALEWYDMSIYALLAIYIGHNFFPSDNPAVEVIQAFAVFGASYLIRPLGGLILAGVSEFSDEIRRFAV